MPRGKSKRSWKECPSWRRRICRTKPSRSRIWAGCWNTRIDIMPWRRRLAAMSRRGWKRNHESSSRSKKNTSSLSQPQQLPHGEIDAADRLSAGEKPQEPEARFAEALFPDPFAREPAVLDVRQDRAHRALHIERPVFHASRESAVLARRGMVVELLDEALA